MANCPICQAEFVEGQVKTCVVCGWDLTPYPVTFAGQIPEAFLEKERNKLAWARETWAKSTDLIRNLNEAQQLIQSELGKAVQTDLEQLQHKLNQLEAEKLQFQDGLRESQLQIKTLQRQLEQRGNDLEVKNQTIKELRASRQQLKTELEQVKQQQIVLREQLGVAQKKLETFKKSTLSLNQKVFSFEVVIVDKQGKEFNRQLKTARGYSEDLGKGIFLEMVEIPGGKFLMGSPEKEVERLATESPQHWVTVPTFYMGRYLVTQAQYEAVMENNPSCFKGANRPVEWVSWNEATEFCEKLTQLTQKIYRLPSEAEWEYSCRAETTTPFHFGETVTSELVNYESSYRYGNAPKSQCRKQTTDVGFFQVANVFGLYDMHGNVSEWCQDIWHENYQGAPTDGSAWETGGDNRYRLLRGGSWSSYPNYCRSASRNLDTPDFHYSDNGFRVVSVGLKTVSL